VAYITVQTGAGEGLAMKKFWVPAAALALVLTACGQDSGSSGGTIRVALGDIESVETLGLMIALERVKERGIDVELQELADEDLANQAVVGGQADVGLGAPYGLIQGSGAPLRIFCQLQTLRAFPVVDKAMYPDWQSLDGEPFTVHSRGSSTEALARMVEQIEGIKFEKLSYVSSSEVRATALLRGDVTATMLDIPNKNYVMKQAPGRFHMLPVPDTGASDEVLFGNTEWIDANKESVQVLLEETLTTWRSINEDPSWVLRERKRLGLLPDLPAELEQELLPYYEQAAEEGLFTSDCGGEEAAKNDFEFYKVAGQITGDPSTLNVGDFWYIEPIAPALQNAKASGS
jgi:NitT/TauT family transport system substrate-binding protein